MRTGNDIRKDFPIFKHHPDLVYLDSAATSQKPKLVIEAIKSFYEKENSNIHRSIYDLGAKTSAKYEAVRLKVASLIGVESPKNIVYTSGTTDSINLVAQGYLAPRLNKGEVVLITAMEHHANLIPWQMLCKEKGAHLRIIPITKTGEIDLKGFRLLLGPQVKMISLVHISNALGTINPIEKVIELAHKYKVPVMIDAAQSIAHLPIEVQKMGCDFMAFSAHKMFGPTGIGVLYAKDEYFEQMSPVKFGGDMIRRVSFDDTIFASFPQKFEAGTTHIAGVIGLGKAVDYLANFDRKKIQLRMKHLRNYAVEKLLEVPNLSIIGQAKNCSGIVSFVMKNVHAHDIATFLGTEQIAVRAGQHCAQPLMDFLKIPASTRASFSIYTLEEEIDQLSATLKEVQSFFS